MLDFTGQNLSDDFILFPVGMLWAVLQDLEYTERQNSYADGEGCGFE